MANKKSKRKSNKSNKSESKPSNCILENYIKPEKHYTSEELSAIAEELVMTSEELSNDNKHNLAKEYAMTAVTLYHLLISNKHKFSPCDIIYMEKAIEKTNSRFLFVA